MQSLLQRRILCVGADERRSGAHGSATQTLSSEAMALILTSQIHEFREAVRHLWNSYLRSDATWDTADEFTRIAAILFSECALRRVDVEARPIPIGHGAEVLHEYRIFARPPGRLRFHANRDVPASGYWDHPIEWIPPEKPQTIHPICFFDFDVLGWRRIQYYRVRIVESSSHPELNGRDALIECGDVDVEVCAAQASAGADRGRA